MKRRFEFRLERVRRVRVLEEEVARAERSAAEHAAREAETRRDQARERIARSRALLAGVLTARSIDARSILLSHRALDSELRALERGVESARTARERAERFAAHHREKKTAARALEELRKRALVAHREGLEKAANQELDEAAAARHRRPRRPDRAALRDRQADAEDRSRPLLRSADPGAVAPGLPGPPGGLPLG